MTEPVQATGMDQNEYMKLFMQELTYQDPLKPVDNREFMAQMAQFSALQEARTTNGKLDSLLGMTSGSQGLALLGKTVRIHDGEGQGIVDHIKYFEKEPPRIYIHTDKGGMTEVSFTEISEVDKETAKKGV